MKDSSGTNRELIEEISVLKQRIRELEQAESELRLREEALKEAVSKFRPLAEQSLIGASIIQDGVFKYVNSKYAEIHGYTVDELMNNFPFLDLVYPDDRQLADTRINNRLTGKEVDGPRELKKVKKNGDIIDVIHFTTVKSFKGKPAIFGFLLDITDRKRAEEALQKSEERLQKIFHYSPFGMATSGSDFRFISSNEAFCRILGYSDQELTSLTFKDLTHPDHVTRDAEQIQKLLTGEITVYQTDKKYVRKDGRIIWGTVKIVTMRGRDGQFESFLVMLEDSTVVKGAEIRLRESEEKYRSLASTADLLYLVDRDCRYLFANDNYLDRFGPMRDQVIGKNFDEFHDKELSTIFSNSVRSVFETGNSCQSEYMGKRSGRHFITTFSPVKDTSGNVTSVTVVAKDITERKLMEEALRESEERYRELCVIDDLTQLYNSRYFYDQLEMETDRVNRYGQPLTLLLLDIDDFKGFNDAYGHVEGDQVLSRLGQVIKGCLRHTDSAYRYGGEEFTIILPMTTSDEGGVTAERIRTEFKKESFPPASGEGVHITVSIGLGQYKTREDMKSFVRRVDQLMYRAKNSGKDRVCFDPPFKANIKR